jgi:hypothetical protein
MNQSIFRMPKVALCISGQPRNALYSFPYIKQNIIEPNQADVFIHMHYDPENLYMEKSHADKGICLLQPGLDQQLIQLYQPKSVLVEKPRNFQKPLFQIPSKRLESFKKINSHRIWTDEEHIAYTVKNMTSMYYSIYKANELKEIYANEQGIVYDYVIRIRFDFFPYEPLLVTKYQPNFIHYLEMGQPDELISDWCNFGSNAIMNIYASLYLHMDYLNTFQFYPMSERLPNTLEPSETCGGVSEHMLRDLMYLHHIPKQPFRIHAEL